MSRLFVLGAGFSAPAGLPLGKDLSKMIIEQSKQPWQRHLFENIVKQDLARFQWYKKLHSGLDVSVDSIDFEELISFLDLEHYLRLSGSDTYTNEGNRTQMVVRNLLSSILWNKCNNVSPDAFELYIKFAKHLNPGDIILTFNYDVLMEMALKQAKKRFRLVPNRFESVYDDGGGILKLPEKEIILLKLHGSIDWFDFAPVRENHKHLEKAWKRKKSIQHTIFGNKEEFKPRRITPRPYIRNSRLNDVHRVDNVGEYFARSGKILEAPLIVSPSLNKILYMNPLIEFWWGMNDAGAHSNSLVFIGFSMPPHDDYLKHPLSIIASNYQEVTDLLPGATKTPVLFISYESDIEEQTAIKKNYSFLNWGNVLAWWDGFSMDAVDFIFNTKGRKIAT